MDAKRYYQFLVRSQLSPFNISAFTPVGHNATLWYVVAGVSNLFYPDNYKVFNIWISLLSISAVVCLYFILRHLAQQRLGDGEVFLATGLLAFHPAIAANLLHFTLDTGLFIFLCFYTLSLLKGHRLLAVIFGSCMVLTKETAYALIPLVFVFCSWLQEKEWRAWGKKHAAAVVVPFVLLAAFNACSIIVWEHLPLWHDNGIFLKVWPDITLVNYLLAGFVLNFTWLIVLGLALLARQLWRKGKAEELGLHAALPACVLLLAGTAFIVFGFRHWVNPRYLIYFYWALLLTFIFLLPLIGRARTRITVLLLLLMCMLGQNFRSVDPVSNAVFCSSQWGERRVLHLPTHGRCNGASMPVALDALAYNMEYTHLAPLLLEAAKDIKADARTVFVAASDTYVIAAADMYGWEIFPSFTRDYAPSYSPQAISPRVTTLDGLWQEAREGRALPEAFYSFKITEGERLDPTSPLMKRYVQQGESKLYENEGYSISVSRYVLAGGG